MDLNQLSRRERKKLQTHYSILRSAKHLFREKGYENTSIEDITERADVSKSTFFKHFNSKESLLLGIAQEEVEDLLGVIEEAGHLEEIEIIRLILLRLIEDSIPYLRLTGQVLFTTIINRDNVTSPYLELRKVLEDLVESAQSKGVITNKHTPSEIVISILACYYGVIFKWFEDGGKPGNKEEAEKALSILFDSILVN